MGLLTGRRCVELRVRGRPLVLWLPELPVLDARERERLFGRPMTAEEVAGDRAARRRRFRARLRRIWRWRPWDGS